MAFVSSGIRTLHEIPAFHIEMPMLESYLCSRLQLPANVHPGKKLGWEHILLSLPATWETQRICKVICTYSSKIWKDKSDKHLFICLIRITKYSTGVTKTNRFSKVVINVAHPFGIGKITEKTDTEMTVMQSVLIQVCTNCYMNIDEKLLQCWELFIEHCIRL